jgi:hypothetical protein
MMLAQDEKPNDWADCCGSLGVAMALAMISITATRRLELECSNRKSSAKLCRFALIASGSILKELVRLAWPTGLHDG